VADPVRFELTHCKYAQQSTDIVERRNFGIILLDLSLPMARGLITGVRRMRCAECPICGDECLGDEELAVLHYMKVRRLLVKGQVDSDLLIRAMRYTLLSVSRRKMRCEKTR